MYILNVYIFLSSRYLLQDRFPRSKIWERDQSSGNVLGSRVRISTYKERDGHGSRQWEKLWGSIVTAKFQSSPWAALQLGWPFRVSSCGEGTGSLYCIVCVCVCVCVCVSCLVTSNSLQPHRPQPTRPPSMGFSSQEHWSGSPFPSPKETIERKWSRSVVSDCLRPHGL